MFFASMQSSHLECFYLTFTSVLLFYGSHKDDNYSAILSLIDVYAHTYQFRMPEVKATSEVVLSTL